jgi:hypothetical protein
MIEKKSVMLAFSAVLAAAPAIGLQQSLIEHGGGLTETERTVLSGLSATEVRALSSLSTQIEDERVAANNNNNNNIKLLA